MRINIKKKYNLSDDESLIIMKTDIKNVDLSSTNVKYEIYHPYTLEKLNMEHCKEVKIVVNSPVNLDNQTIALYNSLIKSGYNLFDTSDSFYNDICTTYTSENGTDVTIDDRQNELFANNANFTLCQSECTFESYNVITNKVKCNCEVQKNSSIIDFISSTFNDNNIIINTFLITFKYSNIMVIKCYKFAIDLSSLTKNIGRIIMSAILFLFLIMFLIFFFYDRKKINYYINLVLKNKNNKLNIKNKKSFKSKPKHDKIDIKKNNKLNNKNSLTKKNKIKEKNKTLIHKKASKILNKNMPPKKKAKEIKNKSINKNEITSKNNLNDISKNELMNKVNKKGKGLNINIIPIKNVIQLKKYKSSKNSIKSKMFKRKPTNINIYKKPKSINKKIHNKNENINFVNLNDAELNTLSYNNAILYDKRTYFQYYKSLLKKRQIILFTFVPANDYNLFTIKFCLFLLSFSLYFSMNVLFFSDSHIHLIFIENGSYNLIYQIPKLIYSTLVSSLINTILKLLALTESNILRIKNEKNIKEITTKVKSIRACITIKFIAFFISSSFLLLFFWYFVSCFCGVYINTQYILIQDIIISFGMSMIYPFGLALIPGIFRIPALRAQKRDKKCLYQFSGLISLVF